MKVEAVEPSVDPPRTGSAAWPPRDAARAAVPHAARARSQKAVLPLEGVLAEIEPAVLALGD
jgi:hypothetical protein